MSKSKKAYTIRICSFIVNLIEGAIAVFVIAVIHAFIHEPNDNNVRQVAAGVLVFLFIWLFILFIPNIIFSFIGKLSKKDMAVFQILPLLLGVVFYVVFHFN